MERLFYPEGMLLKKGKEPPKNKERLLEAIQNAEILEGQVIRCDNKQNLLVDAGCMKGIIPKEETALGVIEGVTPDIAIISRVGKVVSYIPEKIVEVPGEEPYVLLSRRKAQKRCQEYLEERLKPGDICRAIVTKAAPCGLFLDLGCGVVGYICIENISVSRISHPNERVKEGEEILAVVRENDKTNGRITMSLKELMGTWEENAALFQPGDTVPGIVRSVEPYGIFIELTPNLTGLSEYRQGMVPGENVSVYIKSINAQKMKIKLVIVEKIKQSLLVAPLPYFIREGHINEWVYTPSTCTKKTIATYFIPKL
jgi:small subunit ribosomal protein S1